MSSRMIEFAKRRREVACQGPGDEIISEEGVCEVKSEVRGRKV